MYAAEPLSWIFWVAHRRFRKQKAAEAGGSKQTDKAVAKCIYRLPYRVPGHLLKAGFDRQIPGARRSTLAFANGSSLHLGPIANIDFLSQR